MSLVRASSTSDHLYPISSRGVSSQRLRRWSSVGKAHRASPLLLGRVKAVHEPVFLRHHSRITLTRPRTSPQTPSPRTKLTSPKDALVPPPTLHKCTWIACCCCRRAAGEIMMSVRGQAAHNPSQQLEPEFEIPGREPGAADGRRDAPHSSRAIAAQQHLSMRFQPSSLAVAALPRRAFCTSRPAFAAAAPSAAAELPPAPAVSPVAPPIDPASSFPPPPVPTAIPLPPAPEPEPVVPQPVANVRRPVGGFRGGSVSAAVPLSYV